MSVSQSVKKEKKLITKTPHIFVILLTIIVVAMVLTWVLPAGKFERVKNDAGITVATHLGNVMTGLHHRDIGTMGACLTRPEVD